MMAGVLKLILYLLPVICLAVTLALWKHKKTDWVRLLALKSIYCSFLNIDVS